MTKLAELQRRKTELASSLEQQRAELKKTFIEVREEIEPGNLLKKALSGALGFPRNKAGDQKSGTISRLPAPIAFLVDVLVRDPKWALGLKLLAPIALKYWPSTGNAKEKIPSKGPMEELEKPAKIKFYSRLREGISSLRNRLRKTDLSTGPGSEIPEN